MNDWLNTLPEDMRGSEVLKRFNSVEDLAKNVLESESYRGRSVSLPTSEADEAQLNEAYQKIQKHFPGVVRRPDPEKGFLEQNDEFYAMFGVPEKYEAPEGVLDDASLEIINGIAAKAKMSRDQYDAFIKDYSEAAGNIQKQNEEGYSEQMKALDNEWGMAAAERKAWVDAQRDQFNEANPDDQLAPFNSAAYKLLWSYRNQLGGGKTNGEIAGSKQPLNAPGEAKQKRLDLHRSQDWKDMMKGKVSAELKRNLIEKDINYRKQENG